jgi:hypothetical protein
VRIDVYNAATGLGVACGTTIDTQLIILNAAWATLAVNDDRAGVSDQCSGLDYSVPAGTTIYVRLIEMGDNFSIPGYLLRVVFN